MNDTSRPPLVYKPVNRVRFVTAASLFDGHDASINIMRRILQSIGCEVIHLGHNRSVDEIVNCAIQEDAHAHRRSRRTRAGTSSSSSTCSISCASAARRTSRCSAAAAA